MTRLPDNEAIRALHQKYAPSEIVFTLVWEHCCIVRDIALQCIDERGLAVDRQLVEVGSLLHDIGVYPLFTADGTLREGVHYITHGTEGECILRDEGFPEYIWRFASHHTGVGLSKTDITEQELPLPAADYLAESDEEILIMYADKFHSKTTPPYFNSYAWYKNDVSRFGEDKAVKFAAMADKFGIPNLAPLAQQYGFEIR